MATIDIGKLTFTHKGDYAGGTAYVANDVVYYNGSAYVAKTSTTGNLPTSTAHWNTFAAGSGGIWNSGLSIGSANQSVRVNAAGNALEFYTASGGGVLQIKENINTEVISWNHTTFQKVSNNFKVDITATAANSSFLLEAVVNSGVGHHDSSSALCFFDSLKGDAGDANALPPQISHSDAGSRSKASVAVGHWSMGSSDNTENHSLMTVQFSHLYTPAAAQQSTNARSFFLGVRRNTDNQNNYLNYPSANEGRSWVTSSLIRVTEIANSIT